MIVMESKAIKDGFIVIVAVSQSAFGTATPKYDLTDSLSNKYIIAALDGMQFELGPNDIAMVSEANYAAYVATQEERARDARQEEQSD